MTTEPDASVSTPESVEESAPASPRPAASSRWVAWGTGVAIEIRGSELLVAVARVRPNGATLLGAARLPDFRTRPAAEWGAELQAFLKKHGARHVAATVLLPRHEVIVRLVSLPGVRPADVESAIRLQLDTLHPFSDEDAVFSFARVGKTGEVLVGIARRETVDSWSTLFDEAGVKTARFTFSAAALYSAARTLTAAPVNFVAICPTDDGIEVYGESEARALYSATLPVGADRALGIARSELRLEPDTPPTPITELLPKPTATPEGVEIAAMPILWAAGIFGACAHLGVEANLLPPERRRSSSRWRLIPTSVLAATLGVLLLLLALQSSQADARYLGVLQHEVRRFEPFSKKSEALDRATASARARSETLDSFRRRTRQDMDALAETTKLIPPPGWVSSLDIDRATVSVSGEVDSAATLLKTFDASPQFERTEFGMPIARSGNLELFRIRAQRQTVLAPVPAVVPSAGGQK